MAVVGRDTDHFHRLALDYHRKARGKVKIASKVTLQGRDDLSLAYTPGVAAPCREIAREPELSFEYTARGNMVAVVSDGTAVLGLGDIGPEAAMPVMEGKALLFKIFADVDAVPLCLGIREVGALVDAVAALEPTFGGINLEDISAPRCFEVEARLKRQVKVPVFHDDQHGTAIVSAAALLNAMQVVEKDLESATVVINGAGAAGVATASLVRDLGVDNVILCDSKGAIYEGRPFGMNPYKEKIARVTNPERRQGTLDEVIRGTDVFIGLSVAGAVTADMVRSMAPGAVIMAMANPIPEIYPEEALAAGAKVVCTGRSDYPNQINNVLAFPGVFRGALDVRATDINDEMKLAAAKAIADLAASGGLHPDHIIPEVWDRRVAPMVAVAVAGAAIETGVAQHPVPLQGLYDETMARVEKVWESLSWQQRGNSE